MLRADGLTEQRGSALHVAANDSDSAQDHLDMLAALYGTVATRVAERSSAPAMEVVLASAGRIASSRSDRADPARWVAFLDSLRRAADARRLSVSLRSLHGLVPEVSLAAAVAASDDTAEPARLLMAALTDRDLDGCGTHCSRLVRTAAPALAARITAGGWHIIDG